jgi:hypothetical protein
MFAGLYGEIREPLTQAEHEAQIIPYPRIKTVKTYKGRNLNYETNIKILEDENTINKYFIDCYGMPQHFLGNERFEDQII